MVIKTVQRVAAHLLTFSLIKAPRDPSSFVPTTMLKLSPFCFHNFLEVLTFF